MTTKVSSYLTSLLLAATFAVANPPPVLDPVSPPVEGARLSSKVVLVVDCSGSMAAAHEEAIRMAVGMAEASSDAYQVHCVAFETLAVAWPAGWQDMPSADVTPKLRKWLKSKAPDNGITNATGALAVAADLHPDASVILITDGEFTSPLVLPKGMRLAVLQVGDNARGTAKLQEYTHLFSLGWYRPAKAQ